ncbi:hypothetical protein VitviT2T_030686 [Vitis vinifera]|uniref:Uncharacterized protein n=2 Tax=Vitis vinifera TaxID=29760 RepID=A0ABY9E0F0_VITVI|nr:hypothetical protein VitviT2T_030686 [Vitis vinifera]
MRYVTRYRRHVMKVEPFENEQVAAASMGTVKNWAISFEYMEIILPANDNETKPCMAFSKINFPSLAPVTQVSTSHNHAAFVMQSGEASTCGNYSSFRCGHGDTVCPMFRLDFVEALKEVPYKQVVARFSFAAFLPIKGHVFACGMNIHGQLGYGDTVDRRTLKIVELLEGVDPVVQMAA